MKCDSFTLGYTPYKINFQFDLDPKVLWFMLAIRFDMGIKIPEI